MLDWPALEAGAEPEFRPGNLEAKFVAPPFSVLDTRQGYWQERRRAWLSLGIKSEIGRGLLPGGNYRTDQGVYAPAAAFRADETVRPEDAGTSVFDPVLCELMYRWFAPEGGTDLDPFAGGSVRGIVASRLGHPYRGIDLSERQIAENRRQAGEICEAVHPVPEWTEGDARAVLGAQAATEDVDLVFSCPPYGDLEVYSDHPADLSSMKWPDFVEAYEVIIRLACERLRAGRFAAFVVSEIRATDGAFRGLVPVTIEAFLKAGMRYYNEAILVTSAGTLPLRVTKYMESSRKLGRAHQNVLVFAKGTPERGWSYEREAPPDPQLPLFGDVA